MKKILAVLLIAVLAFSVIFAGCKKAEAPVSQPEEPAPTEEPAEPEPADEPVVDDSANNMTLPVDPAKLIDENKVNNDLFTAGKPTENMAKENYIIQRTQSYDSEWFVEYGAYLPKFTDEISGGGTGKINEYFAAKAETETDAMNEFFADFGIKDEVFDSASMKELYHFSEYSYETLADKYLTVKYATSEFLGGAHGSQFYAVDTFDLDTGELLTIEDVLGNADEYTPIVNAYATNYVKEKEIPIFSEDGNVDIAALTPADMAFQLTPEGINFIFNQYAIAPYAAGTIEITVPYENFKDILKISVA